LGTIWLVRARTLLGVKNHQPGPSAAARHPISPPGLSTARQPSSLPEATQRSFCGVGNNRGSTVPRPDRHDCWSSSRESVGQTARRHYPIRLRAADRPRAGARDAQALNHVRPSLRGPAPTRSMAAQKGTSGPWRMFEIGYRNYRCTAGPPSTHAKQVARSPRPAPAWHERDGVAET
jgi:hypothetical protein